MLRLTYPFTAIVGQEQMRLALLVAAVDPSVGGVLVSGHKGTAKSTAVRSLHALLPELEAVEGCPYRCSPDGDSRCPACEARTQAGEPLPRLRVPTPLVELPLNATEDRVAGTLNVERALREGERRFEPGLLAAANRGLLYVDEVNLLDDHLVDLLLDAAASGVNSVEREGVSHAHPARFVLLGTMNPEEGSLLPQFLDRFGLFATVSGIEGIDARAEIARRRLAFEADPAGFCDRWSDAQQQLAARIREAQRLVKEVSVGEPLVMLAVRLAAAAKARGHRAEIAIVKAARALAALQGRREVGTGDVADAARFVLPHRMAAGPLDSPEKLDEKLAGLVDDVVAGRSGDEIEDQTDASFEEEMEAMAASMQVPGSFAAGSILFAVEKKKPEDRLLEADERVCIPESDLSALAARSRRAGRRGLEKVASRGGRYARAAPLRPGEPGEIAADATLRAAALRRARNGTAPLPVRPGDLRRKIRERLRKSLVVLVVDASDSMGTGARMSAAKGAALALLTTAYQRRDRVAVVAFEGEGARVLLEPTASTNLAQERLRVLPIGGATPLAHGLWTAWELVRAERLRDPQLRPTLALLSDGGANVPMAKGADVRAELRAIAVRVRADGVESLVLDASGPGDGSFELARLAEALGGRLRRLKRMEAAALVEALDDGGRA